MGKNKSINLSNFNILDIKKISESKFKVGGAAILAALNIKINKLIIGKIKIKPLFK
jgi:hypothetical protein